MSVEATLGQFKETESSEPFRLQGSKMLKVELADQTIQAKLGSMVAYQGDVKFEHAGSGGLKRMAKKAVTGQAGAQSGARVSAGLPFRLPPRLISGSHCGS